MKGWDWDTETSILLCYSSCCMWTVTYMRGWVGGRFSCWISWHTLGYIYTCASFCGGGQTLTILPDTWYLRVVIKLVDLGNYSCYQIFDHTTIYHGQDHSKMESSSSHVNLFPRILNHRIIRETSRLMYVKLPSHHSLWSWPYRWLTEVGSSL